MATQLATGVIHHLRLTVADVNRSREFYTGLLGFQMAMELPPGVLLSNGHVVLGLFPAPDASRALLGDRFDENRVGLDHLSFSMGRRDDLDRAMHLFDEHGVPHGEIKDLGPGLAVYVLAFRDPDNIQLELTAPYMRTEPPRVRGRWWRRWQR
jgi:glyoxylase I family protein